MGTNAEEELLEVNEVENWECLQVQNFSEECFYQNRRLND